MAAWSTTATPTPACANQQAVVELMHSKSMCIFAAEAPKARRSVWPKVIDCGEAITRSPSRLAGRISRSLASGWSLRITQANPQV
jgi:hypothetical protein